MSEPVPAVVVERDDASPTGWVARWMHEEGGRAVVDTTTPVEPQQFVDSIDCEHVARHDRLRYEARFAEARERGWLTPDEVREALARPWKGTVSSSAAPADVPLPRRDAGCVRADDEAGVDTRRGDGAGPDVTDRPGVGEAGHTAADPRPISLPLRALRRLRRQQ